MKTLLDREMQSGESRVAFRRRARTAGQHARGLRFERLEPRTLLASDITIVDGPAGTGTLDAFLSPTDGTLTTADGGAVAGTLSSGALAGVGAGVNISINATTSITFND